jgi:DNA-binding response OmpR family regulator
MRGSAEAGAATLAGARILVVEDDFLVLLDIATVLSDAGATVLKCATVEQALQTIAADTFAAALLDVRLGRNTIAPVARKLTELGRPFAFYTGQVMHEATLSQWPGARIVSKPASPVVLVNAVAELLRFAQAAPAV